MFYYMYKLNELTQEKMLDYIEKQDVRGYIVKDDRGFLYVRLNK